MFLYLLNVYHDYIQQKKKEEEEEEEEGGGGQTFCHLCHLIMDMFTHTDIFSTLYTQET